MSADLHRRLESAREHLVPEWSEVRGNLVYAAVLRRRARRQTMKRSAGVTLALLVTIAAGVMLGARETKAVLRFADGSIAVVGDPTSELEVVEQSASAVRLRLIRGSSRFEVNYDPERIFEVEAAGVRVRDLGTVFSVTHLGSEVEVGVHSGRVRVDEGGKTFELAAGQSARVAAVPASTRIAQTGAEAPPDKDPATAVRELFERADRAREAGDARAAIVLLDKIVSLHPGDPRAAVAAFTIGRVALLDLDDPRKAALAFRDARELAPAGPLAEDALAREAEAWSLAGEEGMARRRAKEYLELYPRGLRAQEVRRWSSPR